MNMSVARPDVSEPPDGRISWSIYALALVFSCLICAMLAPFGIFPFLAGGAWFWIALVLGAATAVVVNVIRPRYESAAGRWRTFYDFLLKQLPPAD
jgi:hypothetical protein